MAELRPEPERSRSRLLGRWGMPALRSRAWWIAAAYAAFAALWIYYSDRALLLVASDDDLLELSVYKGWAFVLVTSTLLLLMMRRGYGEIEQVNAVLRTQAERLRQSEQRQRMVLASAMDAIIAVDRANQVILYNDAAQRMFGWSHEDALGKPINAFLAEDPDRAEATPRIIQARHANGESFPAEVTRSTAGFSDGGLYTLVLRDIRERLEREQEIERLNCLYQALGRINQAIATIESQDQLLSEVCKTLCEVGALKIAWIGHHDDDSRRIIPVASHGDTQGFLEGVVVYSDRRSEGLGPTGTAFRENRSYICNDLNLDPATIVWRDRALRLGLHACAALPIRSKDRPKGVLVVYANEAGYFQDKEMALLEEVALDLSFALENLIRTDAHRQAEATALRERQFSEAMLDSMPGILYFYDEAGRFLRWNRNFQISTGYAAEEIAVMHPLDFIDSEDRPLVAQRIAEALRSGESSVEASLLSRDGRTTPFFFTGRRTEFEGRACLVGVGIDISVRKRAERALQQSEQRYRSTLDNILEGCQLIGFDWRYRYLNDAAEIHNRRPNSELLGQSMLELWPGIVETDVFAMLKDCMENRNQHQREVAFKFPDSTTGYFDLRVHPVPEGIFILSVDITDRHQAELDLRRIAENLEVIVAERTAELKRALVAAESADRLKSAFLATMSHELRTPLNSIIGFTGVVLQELPGPLNPEQTKQLSIVRTSALHLLSLINDVLDLSKIEAGQLDIHLQEFDLGDLIEQVLAIVQPLAERKGLALEASVWPSLGLFRSDRRRIKQILLNLLNNAIKFTEQGQVELIADEYHATPDRHTDSTKSVRMLRVCIIDTGPGIRQQDLDALFQPFRQIDAGLTRQHEGTGLGLAICRRLAHLLGGEISVASQWQSGSRFCLLLPFPNGSAQ